MKSLLFWPVRIDFFFFQEKNALEEISAAANQNVLKMEMTLEDNDSEIRRLKEEIGVLKTQVADLTKQASKSGDAEKAKQELSDAKAKIATLEKTISQLKVFFLFAFW